MHHGDDGDVSCRKSEEQLRKVMKTVSESFGECHWTDSSPVLTGAPAVITRSSSAVSDDSLSDLMEHFMSEMDLVFSDILAEEVSCHSSSSRRPASFTVSSSSSAVKVATTRWSGWTCLPHFSYRWSIRGCCRSGDFIKERGSI